MHKPKLQTQGGFINQIALITTAIISTLASAAVPIQTPAHTQESINVTVANPPIVIVSKTQNQTQEFLQESEINANIKAPIELSLSQVRVKKIINPITYLVNQNGEEKQVRLIGIRLPFSAHCVENYEIGLKTNDLLYLLSDVAFGEHDPEGNLLRYAYLPDQTMLNEKLINEGIVEYYNFLNTPFLHEEVFKEIQAKSQKEKRGRWAENCNQKTIETKTDPKPQPSIKPSSTPQLQLSSLVEKESTKSSILAYIEEEIVQKIDSLNKDVPSNSTSQLFSITSAASSAQSAKPEKSLSANLIFDLINQHRTTIGKPAFSKDPQICSIAQARGPELYDEIFVTHTMHAGFYKLNLPYRATENLAHYKSEEIIVNWWLNSPIHRKAIESDHTHSCGACYGNSCSQIFTSFVAK